MISVLIFFCLLVLFFYILCMFNVCYHTLVNKVSHLVSLIRMLRWRMKHKKIAQQQAVRPSFCQLKYIKWSKTLWPAFYNLVVCSSVMMTARWMRALYLQLYARFVSVKLLLSVALFVLFVALFSELTRNSRVKAFLCTPVSFLNFHRSSFGHRWLLIWRVTLVYAIYDVYTTTVFSSTSVWRAIGLRRLFFGVTMSFRFFKCCRSLVWLKLTIQHTRRNRRL